MSPREQAHATVLLRRWVAAWEKLDPRALEQLRFDTPYDARVLDELCFETLAFLLPDVELAVEVCPLCRRPKVDHRADGACL
jgi:hypothetical protein